MVVFSLSVNFEREQLNACLIVISAVYWLCSEKTTRLDVLLPNGQTKFPKRRTAMPEFSLPHDHGAHQHEEEVRRVLADDARFSAVAELFRSLGDPTRVRIFWLLSVTARRSITARPTPCRGSCCMRSSSR